MSIMRVVSYLIASILLFFGVVFIIASTTPGKIYRLPVGLILTGASIAIFYMLLKPKPKIYKIEVTWQPSGEIAVEALTCPKCGAPLPKPKPGQEYLKCPYCGATIKLVEKPIW